MLQGRISCSAVIEPNTAEMDLKSINHIFVRVMWKNIAISMESPMAIDYVQNILINPLVPRTVKFNICRQITKQKILLERLTYHELISNKSYDLKA